MRIAHVGADEMSSEGHLRSVEEARANIEDALQAEDDQDLGDEWRGLSPDVQHQVAYAVASALTRLHEEKKEQARRKRRAKARKWYWKERKRIQEQVERIAGSPEVSILATITFHTFEECLCPHGRNWPYCESLGQRLVSLRKTNPDASSTYYRSQELRKAQIDPDMARLGEDVCTPGTHAQGPPPQRSAPRNGRPSKVVERTLLDTVIPDLRQADWSYERICEFLATLLIHSFGRKSPSRFNLARALDRLRRKLRPTKTPT
jgi:hypothetical protein